MVDRNIIIRHGFPIFLSCAAFALALAGFLAKVVGFGVGSACLVTAGVVVVVLPLGFRLFYRPVNEPIPWLWEPVLLERVLGDRELVSCRRHRATRLKGRGFGVAMAQEMASFLRDLGDLLRVMRDELKNEDDATMAELHEFGRHLAGVHSAVQVMKGLPVRKSIHDLAAMAQLAYGAVPLLNDAQLLDQLIDELDETLAEQAVIPLQRHRHGLQQVLSERRRDTGQAELTPEESEAIRKQLVEVRLRLEFVAAKVESGTTIAERLYEEMLTAWTEDHRGVGSSSPCAPVGADGTPWRNVQ